ncbi:ROK family protein [Vulcanisaeta thermophila]|uniref:ROK family protein n=1 Tax=Vulcanisaeta thermophila TaxID=867917 RepID=UPI000853D90E|nr:ROK family protein [Vulcanisaeta thermophila]
MVYVGVDVGATFIRVGVVGEGGEVLGRIKVPQPSVGDEDTVARVIIRAIRDLGVGKIDSVGIGSIGPLDLRRGVVTYAPNAPIKRFKLVEPLMKELGVDVVLGNDAMAAVWGEYLFGVGRGIENLVYITISTGIGAGVIVDGHLLVGKDGNAHEIGHAVVDYGSGVRCGCGGLGHWEALASGANVPRVIKEYIRDKQFPNSQLYNKLINNVPVTTEEVFKAYYDGDPLAREFVDNYLMRVNAAGIATVMNAYDPELVVIGGSMALNNREVFMSGIRRYLRDYLTVREARIEFTRFGDDIGIVGAAALAMRTPDSLVKFVRGYREMYGV